MTVSSLNIAWSRVGGVFGLGKPCVSRDPHSALLHTCGQALILPHKSPVFLLMGKCPQPHSFKQIMLSLFNILRALLPGRAQWASSLPAIPLNPPACPAHPAVCWHLHLGSWLHHPNSLMPLGMWSMERHRNAPQVGSVGSLLGLMPAIILPNGWDWRHHIMICPEPVYFLFCWKFWFFSQISMWPMQISMPLSSALMWFLSECMIPWSWPLLFFQIN